MLIGIMILGLMFIAACGSRYSRGQENHSSDNEISIAMSICSTYKKAELNAALLNSINDIPKEEIQNKKAVINLTTASFFNKQSANHMYSRSLKVAWSKGHDLRINYLTITQQSVTDHYIELTYDCTLRFGEGKKDRMFVKGTMTLIKEDGHWKVNSDSYNSDEINDLM
ncbi:hypothetical protein [Paenibacillus sp. sgz500958]|uniref:hypothetical protein n=1 Tax=Paenibacillus sp. sgz500958 TaxID=3242475 RepID=UPI0036D3AA71